ncbi:MAG: alanyl-tRNA synthetase [Microgenomates group bacterium Gr01-1014_16]|nr:MAG: alanyl-tRNA synthetase [Microgenomates group bacterium Gr01-1014_16]
MVKASEIRQKYLKFFASRGHKIIPSAPLVPENDPTVLFTTAGMHPLVPYLLGQPHPLGKRLVDYQKCLRTDDIDEVGDTFHHTFFEMLGNWSLGDYFKKEAIAWSYEFLTQELNIDPDRLYVSCFAGDADAPKDKESAAIWASVGIPRDRIYFFGKKDNWWGPAGQTGPCGPDTEMYFDATQKPCGPNCQPGDNCGRFCEIWNDVFMQYNKTADGRFEKLPQPNVDTGMGLDRTTAVINGFDDGYLTDLWQPIIKSIEKTSGKKYAENKKAFRIIADHFRAATFVVTDGVLPSNKERGYILRRLIRRAALQLRNLDTNPSQSYVPVVDAVINLMKQYYPDINSPTPRQTIGSEITKFQTTLDRGLKEFKKVSAVDGKVAFDLFQTYGFPWELTVELALEKGQKINKLEFETEFKKHQDLSRTANKGVFKGGLQDHSDVTTKYHTVTHLLHAALRQILGTHVQQKGSNITGDRLRFDFSHPEKLTPDQVNQVENIINQKISEDIKVVKTEMPKSQALAEGALAFFPERYPDFASVYQIGNFSKELCGGPHVNSTGEIGRIKITKEESAGAGLRRIYATAVSKKNSPQA